MRGEVTIFFRGGGNYENYYHLKNARTFGWQTIKETFRLIQLCLLFTCGHINCKRVAGLGKREKSSDSTAVEFFRMENVRVQ